MVLETAEQALSDAPKYIISPNNDEESPDLWLSVPPFAAMQSPGNAGRTEGQQKLRTIRRTFRINEEEDLIDAVTRFQQERTGAQR
jgi:hypothetical protein